MINQNDQNDQPKKRSRSGTSGAALQRKQKEQELMTRREFYRQSMEYYFDRIKKLSESECCDSTNKEKLVELNEFVKTQNDMLTKIDCLRVQLDARARSLAAYRDLKSLRDGHAIITHEVEHCSLKCRHKEYEAECREKLDMMTSIRDKHRKLGIVTPSQDTMIQEITNDVETVFGTRNTPTVEDSTSTKLMLEEVQQLDRLVANLIGQSEELHKDCIDKGKQRVSFYTDFISAQFSEFHKMVMQLSDDEARVLEGMMEQVQELQRKNQLQSAQSMQPVHSMQPVRQVHPMHPVQNIRNVQSTFQATAMKPGCSSGRIDSRLLMTTMQAYANNCRNQATTKVVKLVAENRKQSGALPIRSESSCPDEPGTAAKRAKLSKEKVAPAASLPLITELDDSDDDF